MGWVARFCSVKLAQRVLVAGQGGEVMAGRGGIGARSWEVSEVAKVKVEVSGRHGGRGRPFVQEKDCVGG